MPEPKNLSAEELARVQQALNEKAPQFKACPLCGTDNWTVVSGAISLTIQPQRTSGTLVLAGGPMLPEIAFVCTHCGNTVLMNAYVLGLADLFGFKDRETPASDTTPSPAPEGEKAT